MNTRTLLSFLLTAGIASAQGVHFGLQAGVSLPQGDVKDLVDSKTGYTVGLNLSIEFNGGHAIRPRLDITEHSRSLYGLDLRNTTTFFGADYNYFVGGKAGQGPYLLVGLGVANTRVKLSAYGYGSDSENKTAFAYGFGTGWQFTPLVGAELRYASTHPNFGGGSAYKNDVLNLSVTFRFGR